jgi:hypothetical protein
MGTAFASSDLSVWSGLCAKVVRSLGGPNGNFPRRPEWPWRVQNRLNETKDTGYPGSDRSLTRAVFSRGRPAICKREGFLRSIEAEVVARFEPAYWRMWLRNIKLPREN